MKFEPFNASGFNREFNRTDKLRVGTHRSSENREKYFY
jgi:hypothetical protein